MNSRRAWRRRLALLHHILDLVAASQRVWLEETLAGQLQLYHARPGRRIWIYPKGETYVPLDRADLHHHHPGAYLPAIHYRIIG